MMHSAHTYTHTHTHTHKLLRVELTVNLPTLEPFLCTPEEWTEDAVSPCFRHKLKKSVHKARTATMADTLEEESVSQKETILGAQDDFLSKQHL